MTAEAQPVTATAQAQPIAALDPWARNRTFSGLWVRTVAHSSDKEFKQYLLQKKREAEQNLAHQRREFDAWLALQ
jgi:hypothetical protein